jgi:hypothetical protein
MNLCGYKMDKSNRVKTVHLRRKVNDLPVDWSIEDELERQLKKTTSKGYPYGRIKRSSLDARKRDIYWDIELEFSAEPFPPLPTREEWISSHQLSDDSEKVAIIGFGPAGIFACLRLIELGLKPVVFERGKSVRERRRDVAILNRELKVNPDSNYCHGEGGAGTFSDGKLYTRSKKRGNYLKVMDWLIIHGAKASIRYESKPHIGTNKLPGIIQAMRDTIIACGGEVHFNSRLEDIKVVNGRVNAIHIGEQEHAFNRVILATGHSARDIFHWFDQNNFAIEAKPFALGVRVEHPQTAIDQNQYHRVNSPHLPPAYYQVVTQVKGKGVFSFCMCPGGIIAPSMTEEQCTVVNGWSPSTRSGEYANSGFVTSIDENDWKKYSDHGALAGLKLQEEVERKAREISGKPVVAPAQRLTDFIDRKKSADLPANSYIPGLVSVNLHEVLPRPVAERIRKGFLQINRSWKGYIHPDAIVVGVESRTSSPVKIPRTKELQHPEIKGLYPCGEGAGYAGGIVSAAMDGMRCAEAIDVSRASPSSHPFRSLKT